MRSARNLATLVAIACCSQFVAPGLAAAQDDGPSQREVVSRPGEVIIETIDGIDANNPNLIARVEAVRAEGASTIDGPLPTEWRGRTAAAVTGITVTYLNTTPSDVKGVVNAAVADWNAVLGTSTGGPVSIVFDWRNLTNQGLGGVLGYAGPTQYIQRGNSFVPVALANTLDNTDYYNGPEIEVTIASEYYNSGWYVSATNDNVPFNRLDLYATVLHEIAHGLGFLGSAQVLSGTPQLQPTPDKYDTLVRVDGTPLLSLANPNSYLTSNNLDISIGGGQTYKLFAPSSFLSGSSFSHFDENAYPSGVAGSLMSPALSNGEVERVIDGPALGVLSESGWPMDVLPIPVSLSGTAVECGSISPQWSVDLGQNGTPATSFVAEALQNATVIRLVTVAGSATTATIDGLTNGQTYTIRVTPRTKNKSGPAATTTRTLEVAPDPPQLVTVTGSGFNRTISWTAGKECGSPISSYSIDASTNGGNFAPVGTSNSTSLTLNGLTNDVYQFRVRALSASGPSDYGFTLPIGVTNTVVRPFPLDGQIARLYETAFDRPPDGAGMGYYLGLRAAGVPLLAISDGFVVSKEFIERYGSLSNRAFVDLLYMNVLGRAGESAGVDYWTSQLDAGLTRGQLVVAFSESPEFVVVTGTAASQHPTEGLIYRLFFAYFLRPPDDAGLEYWTGQVANGASFSLVSDSFAASAEFIDRYGSLTNEGFLTLIYANVLTRTPDTVGYDYWLGQLNAGLSRGDVMLAFSDSAEFVLATGTIK